MERDGSGCATAIFPAFCGSLRACLSKRRNFTLFQRRYPLRNTRSLAAAARGGKVGALPPGDDIAPPRIVFARKAPART